MIVRNNSGRFPPTCAHDSCGKNREFWAIFRRNYCATL